MKPVRFYVESAGRVTEYEIPHNSGYDYFSDNPASDENLSHCLPIMEMDAYDFYRKVDNKAPVYNNHPSHLSSLDEISD